MCWAPVVVVRRIAVCQTKFKGKNMKRDKLIFLLSTSFCTASSARFLQPTNCWSKRKCFHVCRSACHGVRLQSLGNIFCRFANKESATQAIVAVHGTEVGGHMVKCSWGKESSDPQNSSSSTTTSGAPGAQPVRSTHVCRLFNSSVSLSALWVHLWVPGFASVVFVFCKISSALN